jgi:fumarate hydratase subunit beta
MIELIAPISEEKTSELQVGDIISISGDIFCGRDAVLPIIIKDADAGISDNRIDFKGGVVFHTAVSPAGVGPTSSNKKEIEESFEPLAKLGVKLFLGKGSIHPETINILGKYNSVFAVIPPTSALFEDQTLERELIAHPELGMEALYRIRVKCFQAIIAVAHDKSIYK